MTDYWLRHVPIITNNDQYIVISLRITGCTDIKGRNTHELRQIPAGMGMGPKVHDLRGAIGGGIGITDLGNDDALALEVFLGRGREAKATRAVINRNPGTFLCRKGR